MPRRIYDTYKFGDVDPVIDAMRTMREIEETNWSAVAEKSGVRPTTYYNWMKGKTKRPQFASITATALALGYNTIDVGNGTVAFRKRKVADVVPLRPRKRA